MVTHGANESTRTQLVETSEPQLSTNSGSEHAHHSSLTLTGAGPHDFVAETMDLDFSAWEDWDMTALANQQLTYADDIDNELQVNSEEEIASRSQSKLTNSLSSNQMVGHTSLVGPPGIHLQDPISTKRKSLHNVGTHRTPAEPKRMRVLDRTVTATSEHSAPAKEGFQAEREQQMQQDVASKGTGPRGRETDLSSARPRVRVSPSGRLDPRAYFTVQVGLESFQLRGDSLESDAPSYLSEYFKQPQSAHHSQEKILKIDRDPATFRLIALHLRGYPVEPRDEYEYARLLMDALYFELRKLVQHLLITMDFLVRVGDTLFRIPRDIFTHPGDGDNYFVHIFEDYFRPLEALEREWRESQTRPYASRRRRPPMLAPPSVPSRDGELFRDILRLLRNQEVQIRDAMHRKRLLQEAEFFRFLGLAQRLIPCNVSYNLATMQSEILIPLEHIKPSGISCIPDQPARALNSRSTSSDASLGPDAIHTLGTYRLPVSIGYARPYVDDHAKPSIAIVEISAPGMTLHFPAAGTVEAEGRDLHVQATFPKNTLRGIVKLLRTIVSKLGLSVTQPLGSMLLKGGGGLASQPLSPATSGISDEHISVRISSDCDMELDGAPVYLAVQPGKDSNKEYVGIRKAWNSPSWVWPQNNGKSQEYKWFVTTGQWKLRVEPVDNGGVWKPEVVFCGVRIQAFSQQRARNKARDFLNA